jgi:hypothetical protein
VIHASDRTIPPYTDKDIPSQRRESRAAKPRLSRIRYVGGVIEAALARVGTLPYDSRDGLPSKKQQLAELGISWATDAAYGTVLAQELADSRLHRHAGVAAATPAEPVVPPPAVGDRFHWSVGMLLIRAGRRLQEGHPVRNAV